MKEYVKDITFKLEAGYSIDFKIEGKLFGKKEVLHNKCFGYDSDEMSKEIIKNIQDIWSDPNKAILYSNNKNYKDMCRIKLRYFAKESIDLVPEDLFVKYKGNSGWITGNEIVQGTGTYAVSGTYQPSTGNWIYGNSNTAGGVYLTNGDYNVPYITTSDNTGYSTNINGKWVDL